MKNQECDINRELSVIAKDKKTLIIGSGLYENTGESSARSVFNNFFLLLQSKSITLSDIDFNNDVFKIFAKSKEYQKIFDRIKDEFSIDKIHNYPKTYDIFKNVTSLPNSYYSSLLKEKFVKFSITNKEYDIENYDVFHLRYILHLKEFNDVDRIKIIDKLYDKLNSKGKIYIQNYFNHEETVKHSDLDLITLREKYSIEEYTGFQPDGYITYTYKTIVINKP